jgi:hypothetical protein
MHRKITRDHLAGWSEGQNVQANREMMRLTFQIVAHLLSARR